MRKLFPDYSMDTSALIDLKYLYPRDIFPTLWFELEKKVKNGNVIATRVPLIEFFKEMDWRF